MMPNSRKFYINLARADDVKECSAVKQFKNSDLGVYQFPHNNCSGLKRTMTVLPMNIFPVFKSNETGM